MEVRAVIVDDEKGSRETIAAILKEFCPQINTVGEADGVESGFELISLSRPDVVFLDVEMQDGTGFDLLKRFDKFKYKVIFITGHDAYAITAFKFSALDFILKPVTPEALVSAVKKVESSIEKDQFELKVSTLLHNIEKENKKLTLRTTDSLFVVPVKEIIRCEANGNYTEFFLENGEKILVSTTLKEYEEMLTPYQFYRPHHSHLINLNSIIRFDKKEGGFIVLKDNSTVPVSFRKKENLMQLLLGL